MLRRAGWTPPVSPSYARLMQHRIPLATVLVAAGILLAVLLPGSTLPPGPRIPGFDKMVHGGMFCALALAVSFDFRPRAGRRLLVVLAAVVAFAALTELCQLFVPGRSCDALDMLADIAGFVFGLFALRLVAFRAVRSS